MHQTLTFLLIFSSISLFSQEKNDTSALTIGGYADAYYSWYSNAKDVALQQHDCIGAYHNNFGLNIAQVTAAYERDRVRGVATFHFGDIPAITWAGTYRNIQEANAGVRFANRLWLDVGFFKTHVGTESFLPKDNLMSIISLGTFYGPFYQSGARLSYDTKSDWHFELHAINGYNLHIDNNDYKTFGMLVSHQFNDRFFMSYSNMLGQENVGQLDDGYLVYQNIFSNLTFKKLDVQVGLDVAMADNWKTGQGWLPDPLIAGLATFKYHFSEKFAASFRGEIFSDESSINSWSLDPMVISSNNQSIALSSVGMTIYGGTIGIEYAPSENGFLRIESRTLYNPQASTSVYPDGFSAQRARINPMLIGRAQVIATVGFYFDKSFKFAR
jgi:hypothetical protein